MLGQFITHPTGQNLTLVARCISYQQIRDILAKVKTRTYGEAIDGEELFECSETHLLVCSGFSNAAIQPINAMGKNRREKKIPSLKSEVVFDCFCDKNFIDGKGRQIVRFLRQLVGNGLNSSQDVTQILTICPIAMVFSGGGYGCFYLLAVQMGTA